MFNNGRRSLPIQEFILPTQKSTICMIGKRATGKSCAISNIIDNLNVTDNFMENTLIISPSELMNPFYGSKYPTATILNNYGGDILIEYLQKIGNLRSDEFNEFSGCIVLDDCLYHNRQINEPIIMELIYNAKHYNITFIFAIQYLLPIVIDLRKKLDYIFLFKDDSLVDKKELYEKYCGMFPSLDFFEQVFSQITQDYNCMVINDLNRGNNLTDKIFYFKSKLQYENNVV